MKNLIVLIPILFIHGGLFSQSNGIYVEKTTCTNAIEYNDYIINMIDLIDDAWSTVLDDKELKKANTDIKYLRTLTDKILKSFKKLEGYQSEADFKNSAVNYTTHMNKVSKKELPEFMKIITTDAILTEKGATRSEELIPILDGVREDLFALIEKKQEVFAAKNNFKIEGK